MELTENREQRAKKPPQLIVSILPLPSISQMAAALLTHKNTHTYTQIVLWPPAYTADSPSDESESSMAWHRTSFVRVGVFLLHQQAV